MQGNTKQSTWADKNHVTSQKLREDLLSRSRSRKWWVFGNRNGFYPGVFEKCQNHSGNSFRMCRFLCLTLFILIFLLVPTAHSQHITEDKDHPKKTSKRLIVFPYALYTHDLQVFFGAFGGLSGYLREETSLLGTVFGSSNKSVGSFFYGDYIPLGLTRRLFLNTFFAVGKFTLITSYQNGNPLFPHERAGSNNSSEDNYLRGEGYDIFFWANFNFLLPFGNGKGRVISNYVVKDGLLVSGASGGTSWNPLKSGKTYIQVMPFIFAQHIRDKDDPKVATTDRTGGIRFTLFVDNTDFSTNPSKGSRQRISVSQDFGWFSTGPWTFVSVQLSKFFSLNPYEKWFRQGVLALDFWTGTTPSFRSSLDNRKGRPPPFLGATLGGFFHMRAFRTGRYNDKAVIYYTAEYRLIPDWNPFSYFSWLDFMGVSWIQFVPFVEVGRVASEWSIPTFFTHLKWDLGIGLRAMMRNSVIRIDFGFSPESYNMILMAGQTF